jgi:hypothetical protein
MQEEVTNEFKISSPPHSIVLKVGAQKGKGQQQEVWTGAGMNTANCLV